MHIRTLLNKLSDQIANVNPLGINGELEKQISDTIFALHHSIVAYQNAEVSLKGRLETAEKLKTALNSLALKINSITESHFFSKLSEDVDQIILSAKIKKHEIDINHSSVLLPKIESKFNSKIDLVLAEKLMQSSYRTLKQVSCSESILTEDLFENYPFPGYLHMQKDLEQFLKKYDKVLTEKNRELIKELIPLLEKSYDIDKQISLVYEIQKNINERKDKSQALLADSIKADVVYNIESSIEKLERGQRFLFPGGLDENRYLLFEVLRQKNGQYQFAILNTGKEANFNQSRYRDFLLRWGISNYAETPVFGDLPLEAVRDAQFIEALVGFQSSTGIPNLEKSVYQAINKQFTEKYKSQLTQRELHIVNEWGPSSFDPVLAYVEYALPPTLFLPFQFDMMLRARNDLAQHLPQAKNEDIFSKATLKFIDEKSCKSVDAAKEGFKEHCRNLYQEMGNIDHVYGSVTSLKSIEKLVAQSLEQYLDLNEKFGTRKSVCRHLFTYDPNDKSFGTKPIDSAVSAYDGYQSYQYSNPGMVPNISPIIVATVSYYGNVFFNYVGDAATDYTCRPYANEFKQIAALEKRLHSMQNTIDRNSPLVANQMKGQKQTLISSSIKDLKNVNFEQILSDFRDLFASYGFCPALLNSHNSPLHSAMKGCATRLQI